MGDVVESPHDFIVDSEMKVASLGVLYRPRSPCYLYKYSAIRTNYQTRMPYNL